MKLPFVVHVHSMCSELTQLGTAVLVHFGMFIREVQFVQDGLYIYDRSEASSCYLNPSFVLGIKWLAGSLF